MQHQALSTRDPASQIWGWPPPRCQRPPAALSKQPLEQRQPPKLAWPYRKLRSPRILRLSWEGKVSEDSMICKMSVIVVLVYKGMVLTLEEKYTAIGIICIYSCVSPKIFWSRNMFLSDAGSFQIMLYYKWTWASLWPSCFLAAKVTLFEKNGTSPRFQRTIETPL